MDIKLSIFSTILFLGLFSSSVFGFHGKIILRKDGSIRTEGLGHANFEKTCKVGDYCQYKLHAPGFPKDDYNTYNQNYTGQVNTAGNVKGKFDHDIEGWDTFVTQTFDDKSDEINITLKDIQEGINYAKANLTIIEKLLTDIEAQLPPIRNSLDKAPPCYLNKWEQCQVTTTASSATSPQNTGPYFTGSTTEGPTEGPTQEPYTGPTTPEQTQEPYTGPTTPEQTQEPYTGPTTPEQTQGPYTGPTTPEQTQQPITGSDGSTSNPNAQSSISPSSVSPSDSGENIVTVTIITDQSSTTQIPSTSSDTSRNEREDDYS